jgi:hypothetical protein
MALRRPPRRAKVWSLWKAGRFADCEINAHPLGHEVRFYDQGDLRLCRVFETPELAEAEADEQKRERLKDGWTDRPPVPR